MKGRNDLSRKVCCVFYAETKGIVVIEKGGISPNVVYVRIRGAKGGRSDTYLKNQTPRLFFAILNPKR